jgi:subtilisin-like proprotein convertase family protein
MPLPADPLFNLQWFLKNTGQSGGTAGIDINVEKAWDDYTGTGIKIGIYDDGVEITHPDLAANYNAALQPTIDNALHAGLPILAADNHGTAVAGLIVARGNNNLGVVGVAYNASFGTGRYLGADGATATALLNQQTLYDVVNHSWGTTRNWFTDGPVDPGFQLGAVNGRGGLGTIMLKAAGNERVPSNGEPVGRDANDSANNTSRHIVVVGAIQNTGSVTDYSSPGATILVSAPAGQTGLNQDITTDRVGTAGYNNGTGTPANEPDYAAFNGTSAATPVSSGVAALILQANPNLGWRDVQAIMAYSARHVGSAVGGIAQNYEFDSWQFNGAKNWNGAGLHFSNDYGFGLVDATTAVRLAENWLNFAPAKTSANEVSVTNGVNQTAQAIPDNSNAGLTFNVTLTGAISIEQMALRMELNHTAVGDLLIDLVSPQGVTSNMWLRTNAGTAINADWTFASREFYGVEAAGTWTVRIRDLGTLGTGTIGNVNLTAYGATLTNDTHYIYTPEFTTFTRSTLTDSGGIDIFDAGALMTASTIDLREGNTSNIAGRNMVITTGTVIEHAYGGDGDDVITGNTVNNQLRGGRGNDTLEGGVGADILNGGAGTDTVSYAGAAGSIQIYLTAPSFNGGDAGGDTFLSIEAFTLSGLTDNFYGDNAAQTVQGGGGIDTLFGYGDNDLLNGDAGNDYLLGGDGNDTVNGGADDDILVGDAGVDSINGGDGFDQIFGGVGNDILNGDSGTDYIFGNEDNDVINGGLGQDYLYGEAGADSIDGGAEFDLIQGGEGNDTLFGGDGAGIVNGAFGQGGNDVLRGGTGIDYMWGGDGAVDTGNDTFEITANGSVDVILDFQSGAGVGDVLRITGTANTSFAQMQGAGQFVQVGTYVGVIVSAGNVVYLQNTTVAALNADDFAFV